MKWAQHATRRGEGRAAYRVWCRNVKERDRLEDPCVDGRLTLRWIFRKYGGRHGKD
jgi:hypothetical protein